MILDFSASHCLDLKNKFTCLFPIPHGNEKKEI